MLARRIRFAVTIILIAALLSSSGCWSRRELEELAYVLIMGLDTTPEGNIKLFAQVGLPTQASDSAEGPVAVIMQAEGRDMTEALENIHLQSTRQPDLSHLRMIIISEKFAREGIESILDYLRRNTGVRLNIRVAITDKDFEEMLTIDDPLNSHPAQAIVRLFEINANRSSVVPVEIMTLVSQILEPDREAILPIIEVTEERWLLGKTAVFRGDRMAAALNREQTFGLLLWRNEVTDGTITVPYPNENRDVSFSILSSSTRISTGWDGNKLVVRVRLDSTLDIWEIRGERPEDVDAVANTYMINQMHDVANIARDKGIDFLGLAIHFRRTDPQRWNALQSDWPNVLKDAEFDLQGRVNIRGQGQIR